MGQTHNDTHIAARLDLPAPVLPTTPTFVPAGMCMVRSSTASLRSDRYRMLAFSNLMSPPLGQAGGSLGRWCGGSCGRLRYSRIRSNEVKYLQSNGGDESCIDG